MSLADSHPDHNVFQRPVGRRGFLRGAAAMGLAAGVPAVLARAAQDAGEKRQEYAYPPGRAKNVIFMVSDGMSMGTLTLGDLFVRHRTGKAGAWTTLWSGRGVRRATMRTQSLDSVVTDSAAAGSAWGSGVHINNGSINVRPDGTQLLPIGIHAQQRGKALGVVTTTRVTHATPASFYANSPRRDYEGLIAQQLMARGLAVALGGGERFFPGSLLGQHPNVQVVRTKQELQSAKKDGRLLGLFDQSHMPFAVERSATLPDLSEMTLAALERLQSEANGFVLQIEGGRVDHAAHNNDATALVHDQAEFDRCVGTVLAWLDARGKDDTLLVVTTDHANANPGLTVYGKNGAEGLARLWQSRRSFDWIAEELTPIKNVMARCDLLPKLVREATGYELQATDVEMLKGVMSESRVMPFAEMNKWPCVLGGVLANHFGVHFISGNHAADYVEVTAKGPGSEAIGGLIDNIDLHGVMVSAMALGNGTLTDDMKEPMIIKSVPKPD